MRFAALPVVLEFAIALSAFSVSVLPFRLRPSADARAAPCLKIFRSAGLPCKGRSAASGSRPNLRPQDPPQFHRRKPDRRHRICFLGISPGFFLRLQLHHDLELANTARKSILSAPSNPHKPVFPRVAASVPGQAVKAAACPP